MTAYRVVAPSLDVTSIQFTSIRAAPYRKQNCISVPACVTLPYREKMERREKVAAFFARSYFSTCVLLSFSFLSCSLQWFLSSVRTIFLLLFWLLCSHPWYSFGHINISIPLSLLSWEERRSRDEIVRTTFLSIADRVEVFNARSFLNYSWKRQIRRPFSVRAYGNGDKSDLTAVFLSIENIRSPNFRFLSPFLIFSLRFFLLSLISDIRLSLFNATFPIYPLFLFVFCASHLSSFYLFSCCFPWNLWIGNINVPFINLPLFSSHLMVLTMLFIMHLFIICNLPTLTIFWCC